MYTKYTTHFILKVLTLNVVQHELIIYLYAYTIFSMQIVKSSSHDKTELSLCSIETSSSSSSLRQSLLSPWCNTNPNSKPKQQFRKSFLVFWGFVSKQILPVSGPKQTHSGYQGSGSVYGRMEDDWGDTKLPFSHVQFVFVLCLLCGAISIYNTRSFTLSDSLWVYSYPLSFGRRRDIVCD